MDFIRHRIIFKNPLAKILYMDNVLRVFNNIYIIQGDFVSMLTLFLCLNYTSLYIQILIFSIFKYTFRILEILCTT